MKTLISRVLRKTIFIALIILIFPNITITAQSLHYGLQAGAGVSTIVERTEWGGTLNKTLKFGFKAGATAEFEVMDFLSIGASVSFLQKGDKIKDDFATSSLSLGYIEIPFHVGAFIPIGEFTITGFVGPYTSVAVIGKRQFEMIDPEAEPDFEWNFEENGHDENAQSSESVFTGEIQSYKRFDTGISAGIMFGYYKYRISATYSRGLRDIKPDETINAKNSSFNISLIYYFK
jgi:hypothetical protein